MNQIEGTTGIVGGGITVSYNSDTNNFTFTNGTTGRDSTIKVRGAVNLASTTLILVLELSHRFLT